MPCLAIADDVTIYRCTDAQGRLSLRDTPCVAGEKQQVQTMQRPVDPPPRPQPAPPAPPPPATTPPVVQTVVLQPPRPMYECVTPDGETYTSETPEGNPRWVPLWTLGYPVVVPHRRHGGGFRADVGVHDGRIDGRITIDHSIGGGHRPPIAVGYPAGTWIRDACHPLPQQEVCDRLRDRRSELGRRYNSALQSERQQITRERRGIDARLANDCRNH
ncbi:DUF4124 domain-containing protein [Lysobacter sp. TLK-CK17T]|uniref:DUF4124 domain-containing protein n=2 Tax=Marilutibacter chinensis TaxID=2912247 RepID=A0ABS9HSB8_9GAMM|nr:DUF4124 domain-containing protein [Lysobacter chinensis]MCF7221573.1 DUF4124 domain-containing protein [Lysobacter chinensis]